MNVKDFGRIGVLAGGPSNEREISLESGRAVHKALAEAGAETVFLYIKNGLTRDELEGFNIDVAFIALHGRFGEDGTVQSILEEAGIPYTGSGPAASRLAIDKIASREIFIKSGIDVPRSEVLDERGRDRGDFKMMAEALGFPLVVKPQYEGSSIGISVVKESARLEKAIELAFNYGDRIIVEEYIKGRELTVGILDDEPLPVIEILVKERFYNFEAKYKRGDTEYIAPAKIDPDRYREAGQKGVLAHRALGCEGFSRTDILLDEKNDRMVVLEVNSIPGLTGHSLLPKAAGCAGISFEQLCLRIIQSAFNRKCVIGNEKA
ncbi:MAG: D-alanine--D-alanine ligase [Candidatus Omnitrophica bacterium]|nr:D-alanine--D-alanine ligase [Candidatus Omnitrophota bacterium]